MMDDIKPEHIAEFAQGLIEYVDTTAKDLFETIRNEKAFDDAWEEKMKSTVDGYKSTVDASWKVE